MNGAVFWLLRASVYIHHLRHCTVAGIASFASGLALVHMSVHLCPTMAKRLRSSSASRIRHFMAWTDSPRISLWVSGNYLAGTVHP